MKCIVALLLISGVAGAILKDSFLSKSRDESKALQAESHTLDHAIQSYADTLQPSATLDFLRTLRLCAPCQKFERVGEPHDGGYVMCMDGLEKGLVGAYSYGINGFDGWGMSVASRYHIPLNEYDCTNGDKPKVCKGCTVHFHYECILNNNAQPVASMSQPYKTLTQQLQESGNAKAADRSLLLKIDVEAAEWSVFAEEPVANLKKFREIVVEYHWLGQRDKHNLYLKAVKKIEEAGFAVAHLHGNNYGGGLEHFGEYHIPNVIEVTYIPKPETGCAANIPYRVPQDTPNNAALPEVADAALPAKGVGHAFH